jgi:hypothetical protein
MRIPSTLIVLIIFFPLATLAKPLTGNVTDSNYSGVCKYYPAPMSIQLEHEYFSGITPNGSSVVIDWSSSVVTSNRIIKMSGDPNWSKIAINIITKNVSGCTPGTFRIVPDSFAITSVWDKKDRHTILTPPYSAAFTGYELRAPR